MDGWHRYTAAREIDPGFEVPTVELGDRDPADFVLSRNLHRRHLSAVQRAVCVLEVRRWKGAGRPSADGAGRGNQGGERTNRQLAEEAGCSVSVISAAKRQMLLGRGNDLKTGRESLASVRGKDAPKRPPTQVQKLRAEVAELREKNEAMASELEKLREAGRQPNELALREENETLESRVHLLEEKLRRAERGQKGLGPRRRKHRNYYEVMYPSPTPSAGPIPSRADLRFVCHLLKSPPGSALRRVADNWDFTASQDPDILSTPDSCRHDPCGNELRLYLLLSS